MKAAVPDASPTIPAKRSIACPQGRRRKWRICCSSIASRRSERGGGRRGVLFSRAVSVFMAFLTTALHLRSDGDPLREGPSLRQRHDSGTIYYRIPAFTRDFLQGGAMGSGTGETKNTPGPYGPGAERSLACSLIARFVTLQK